MKNSAFQRGALLLALNMIANAGCSDAGEPLPLAEAEVTPEVEEAPAQESAPIVATEPELTSAAPVVSSSTEEAPAQRSFALLRGTVTDFGDGKPTLGLAGQGTLTNANEVRVSKLGVQGELELVAKAKLDFTGGFALDLPVGLGTLVVDALDLSGRVLGSVVVSAEGKVAGQVVLAAPITTETTLEARVLQEAKKCACQKQAPRELPLLSLDVAALVDAQLTSAVAATAKLGIDVDILIAGLAEAAVTASQARLDALLSAGIKLDLALLAKAEVEALAKLSAGLSGALTGKVKPADVQAELLACLDAALSAAGALSADVRVRAHVASTLSFSSALSASLAGVVRIDAVLFTALRAAVKLQSQLAVTAITDILAAAGANQATLNAALNAGAKLLVDIDAALTVEALIKARVDFVKTLCGNGQSSGLLVDLLVGTTSAVGVLLSTVLDTVAALTVKLDADLKVGLGAVAQVNACGGADLKLDLAASLSLSLQGVIDVLAKFCADVQALGPQIQKNGASDVTAQALAQVLAIAEMLVRVH